MEKERKFIIFFNIIVICILFYILYSFQQYFYLVYHDYFIPYVIRDFCPDWGRIPASFLYRFTKEFLPNLLSIHPQDIVSSFEAILKTISFLLICIVFALVFFLNKREKDKILSLESIFICITSFCLLGIPIMYPSYHNMYFGRIEESVVYFEYSFCLLFYFAFFIFLIYLTTKSKTFNSFQKILIILNAFLLGFWVELFNVSTFFAVVFFLILVSIFNKEVLKNRNLWLVIAAFLIGMFCFYVFSGYSSGTKLLAYSYNWDSLIYNLKYCSYDFLKEYMKYMFWNNRYVYLILIILIIFLFRKKSYNVNLIIIAALSILLGYLAMNLSLIIYIEPQTLHHDGFLFTREMYQILQLNVFEFVILMLLGAFYYEYYAFRKLILVLIILTNIFLLSIFIPNYIQIQKEKSNTKQLVYMLEKNILVYSIFGETVILPESYLKRREIFSREIFMLDDQYDFSGESMDISMNEYLKYMKNKYLDSRYFLQTYYFEETYNKKFKGVIFVDDKIAQEELDKRLKLLNFKKETQKDILENDISFNKLNNYKDYMLKLSDIRKIKINKENENIVLKAEAYLHYVNGEFKPALKLYSLYLKKVPNDIDALQNIADIYLRLKDVKKAEEIYLKLHKIDKNNLSFLYELLKIYYCNKKEYKKALEICDKMIKLQDNMINLYINKAVIYMAMKNKKKADGIFKYVADKEINKINEFLEINQMNSIDEINGKESVILLEPQF